MITNPVTFYFNDVDSRDINFLCQRSQKDNKYFYPEAKDFSINSSNFFQALMFLKFNYSLSKLRKSEESRMFMEGLFDESSIRNSIVVTLTLRE